MASTASTPGRPPTQPGAEPVDLAGLQQVLLNLTQTEDDSLALLQKMLGVLVRLTGARGGANFRQSGGQAGPQMVHAFWPEQFATALPNLSGTLGQLVGEVTTSQRAGTKPLSDLNGQIPTDRWVAIAAPILWQQKVFGAMCLVLDLGAQGRPEPYLAVLQSVAACFQVHVLRRVGGAHQLLSQQMSVVLDAVARSVTARNATEMAYFLANEVQQHLQCHQVAVGWRSRRDKAKVVAISGQTRFNKRGDTARAIRDAMSEALRQERCVSAGGEPDEPEPAEAEQRDDAPAAGTDEEEFGPRPIDLAHQHLMETCQTDRAVTHPLRSGDTVIGAWTFQWRKDHLPSQADERLIAVATGQVGPVVDWARRADQGVLRRGVRTLGRGGALLFGRGHPVAKAVTVGVAALLAILIFVRIPFRVGGACVLQPTPRRYITARFDGVLKEACVRPGAVVAKGTLLAELEDYQLRDQLALARAEYHQADKESHVLWAKGERAKAQLARIQADKAQAKIDLLSFQLDHVKITAPIDGVVLSGDLERARGVPVKRGQVLFELAPVDRMILEVSVLDADAAWVQPGQEGECSLEARPEESIAFAVERVRPQAEIREEKNVFVAEADVANAEGWLRPGMQGTAKIGVGREPIGWVLTRRIVDWFRMKFWW